MIYVIGDIHGRKDKYDDILAKISPKENVARMPLYLFGNTFVYAALCL